MDEEVEKGDDKKSRRKDDKTEKKDGDRDDKEGEKEKSKEKASEEEVSKSPLLGKKKKMNEVSKVPPTQKRSKTTDDEIISQFSSDDEFEAVHSFRLDDFIIKNVFNSKDSIANNAKLPKKILKEHRKFTAVSLNNRVVYVVTNANAKHKHNPEKGSGTCGLSPVFEDLEKMKHNINKTK